MAHEIIDIKGRIIKSYRKTKASYLLYNNLPFFKRRDFWLLFFSVVLWVIPVVSFRHLKYWGAYSLLTFLIISFGLFLLIHRERKNRLRKKKMVVEKGLFQENEAYEIKRLSTFLDELIASKLLLDKKDVDIELLQEYEKMFDDESGFFKVNTNFFIGGGVLLVLFLPLWGEIIRQLLSKAAEEQLMEIIKLIISVIILIYMIVYSLYLINMTLMDFINNPSRECKEISRSLRLLRLNIKIKAHMP